MAKEVPTQKARQGRLGTQVLVVLVVALVLAMIAWWGAEMFGVAIEPENPSGQPATAPTQPVGQTP